MILDLFAGPGGWSEGLRSLGLSDVGIEWDASACATRHAAEHLTIRADVSSYPTGPFVGKVDGLIASPPCQDFSVAGLRKGIAGDKGKHVLEVPRWVNALRPTWVACEQVPPVVDIWKLFARWFEEWGYSTWVGILNAADYGVPQTRERAFLLASLEGVALPPEPTHAGRPAEGLFGPSLRPWVSMEQALGLSCEMAYRRGSGMIERHGERPPRRSHEPAFTLTGAALGGGGGPKMVLRTGTNSMKHSRRVEDMVPYERAVDRPAPTLDCKALHAWKIEERALTLAEALTIQSFRADYPVAGNKSKQGEQIGNAVPPVLAAAVVGALIDERCVNGWPHLAIQGQAECPECPDCYAAERCVYCGESLNRCECER